MSKKAPPIVMHHSVGVVDKDWAWNFLTCPHEVFESQLRWLKKKEFGTITLTQLLNLSSEGKEPGPKTAVLTFDDGYLDNWVFVFPLLKKYGFNGTFFVSPDFVDPRDCVRPTLVDVWAGRLKLGQLPKHGFMSWAELGAIAADGRFEIQSHALSHTWYPQGGRIIDFRHPGDGYIWMTWNSHPARKPYLQKDDPRLIEWGAPVYEHGKSLVVRRFYPDPDLDRFLIDHVKNSGGESFFKGDWRTELFLKVNEYRSHHRLEERLETEEKQVERIRHELRQSRGIIEQKLGTSVRLLCWPGGGLSMTTLRIAQEEGYMASTSSSRDTESLNLKKREGEALPRLSRIGASLYGNGQTGKASRAVYLSGILLILRLHIFRGRQPLSLLSRVILGICKKYNQMRWAI